MRALADRRLGGVVMAAMVLAGCASSSGSPSTSSSGSTASDSSEPAPSTSTSPASVAPGQVAPEGFGAVLVEVTAPDGSVVSYCVWLAQTEAERERGLMQVTSLGGADGMLFRFGVEQSTPFWMKDTVLPLSVAFFRSDGGFVSATDMTPCPPAEPACPTYPPDAPYVDALEVAQGDLARLGIAEGARLRPTAEACEPGG
jgi:uncharacterized membrane protein (UPF0127 family)